MNDAALRDRLLQESVLEELDYQPSIDSAGIGVAAHDGVVTLSGHVSSYAQMLGAERATWTVQGVKAVVMKLDIHYAADGPTDEELAKRALNLLKWDSTVPRDIHLKVSDGWITLEGEVNWQYQKTNAERSLRFLRGLKGITNLIEIEPTADASALRTRISDAFRRSAEVEATRIQIAVRDGGTVELDGEVASWTERAAAERAAWSAPGVRHVVDRLAIS